MIVSVYSPSHHRKISRKKIWHPNRPQSPLEDLWKTPTRPKTPNKQVQTYSGQTKVTLKRSEDSKKTHKSSKKLLWCPSKFAKSSQKTVWAARNSASVASKWASIWYSSRSFQTSGNQISIGRSHGQGRRLKCRKSPPESRENLAENRNICHAKIVTQPR